MTTTTLPLPRASDRPAPPKAVGHVLAFSGLAVCAIVVGVMVGLHRWSYYTAPMTERGYNQLHRLLKPSGYLGELFGIGGFVLMLVPIGYALRKRLSALRQAGSMKLWLDVHIFCGIVGPVLVTFHTTFRFNGIVAVAYWSMVSVVLSGFVGRYLYVRIPRSLRGLELTRAELDARADQISQRIAEARLAPVTLARIEAFERTVAPVEGSFIDVFAGEVRLRRALRTLRRQIQGSVPSGLFEEVVGLIAERASVTRQASLLSITKSAFDVWHVFHMPLVYVMFGIVVLHVALALYLGYVPLTY